MGFEARTQDGKTTKAIFGDYAGELSMEEYKKLISKLKARKFSPAPGPDIPVLREQLAVLVSTGKAKEAIGVQLTYEQVKRLFDKGIEKYYKRYEAFVGAKTTDSLIGSFLMVATKAMCMVLPVKNFEALQAELKKDYIISKELSTLSGSLALKCVRLLALANTALITTKHIDFDARNAEPQAEEIPEQCTTTAEQVHNNFG